MRAAFPHVERPVHVARPALVLTAHPIGPEGLLIWTAMITNAERPYWPGDVAIPAAEQLGLIIPSKVRTAKLATLETGAATRIGMVPRDTLAAVLAQVRSHLGF